MREHEGVRNTAGSAPTRRTRCRSLLVPSPTQIAESGFVAVDFETANRMGGVSACQLAMVKVHDGHIVDRLNTLIRPPEGWDSFEFTYLHGISAADVVDAPFGPILPTESLNSWMGRPSMPITPPLTLGCGGSSTSTSAQRRCPRLSFARTGQRNVSFLDCRTTSYPRCSTRVPRPIGSITTELIPTPRPAPSLSASCSGWQTMAGGSDGGRY